MLTLIEHSWSRLSVILHAILVMSFPISELSVSVDTWEPPLVVLDTKVTPLSSRSGLCDNSETTRVLLNFTHQNTRTLLCEAHVNCLMVPSGINASVVSGLWRTILSYLSSH